LFEHFALAFGESVEHVLDLVLEHRETGFLHRVIGGLVLDEIAELSHHPSRREPSKRTTQGLYQANAKTRIPRLATVFA
jgi:hypothetical protein